MLPVMILAQIVCIVSGVHQADGNRIACTRHFLTHKLFVVLPTLQKLVGENVLPSCGQFRTGNLAGSFWACKEKGPQISEKCTGNIAKKKSFS